MITKPSSSPPPSYNESEATAIPSQSIAPALFPDASLNPYARVISGPPTTQFGPTPLLASSSIRVDASTLPYFDPSSPHAMALAARRTRYRFLSALCWAVIIWMLAGWLVGGFVWDAQQGNYVSL